MGTTFGTYIVPGGGSIQTLPARRSDRRYHDAVGVCGNLASNFVNSGTVYGFYATVCYAGSGGACTQSVTYTTGVGNYSTKSSGNGYLGGLGWNHFAFFELANGEEALGFSDTPWALGTQHGFEGLGDFNDIIFGITGNAAFDPRLLSRARSPSWVWASPVSGLIGRRRFAKK